MRRLITLILLLTTFELSLASPVANALLGELKSSLEQLNPYGVKVNIKYGGVSMIGYYEVDGDSYYIRVDEQELYGDSKVKYEVFNSRKEVVIDSVVEDNSGNILNNPATVFSTIISSYSSNVISDNQTTTTLELKPIAGVGDESIESINLTISKATKLPVEIIYRYGDDTIVIGIDSIEKLTSPITSYSRSKYADYKTIDFR